MTIVDLYRASVTTFGDRVAQIDANQWHQPTPCVDWDVRNLVNHVINEERWSVPLFGGATIAEVGDAFDGDLLGDHPVNAARAATTAAADVVTEPGALDRPVHLSFGDTPADEYLHQLLAEHLVHGWDLAVAIDADPTIDPEAARLCLRWFDEHHDGYIDAGLIAPPVDLPGTADDHDRLLAAFGRDPQWPRE